MLHEEGWRVNHKRGERIWRRQGLRTIPGVGPRLSEAVVAWIDDPHRFRSARAVGSYVGLVPRRRQSGIYDRSGRVTKHGPSLLRKLLVEVVWIMRQHNPHAATLFKRLSKGERSRTKKATVALGRRVLTWGAGRCCATKASGIRGSSGSRWENRTISRHPSRIDGAEIDTTAAAELENSGERQLGNGNEPHRVANLYGTAFETADTPDSDLNRSRIVAW